MMVIIIVPLVFLSFFFFFFTLEEPLSGFEVNVGGNKLVDIKPSQRFF